MGKSNARLSADGGGGVAKIESSGSDSGCPFCHLFFLEMVADFDARCPTRRQVVPDCLGAPDLLEAGSAMVEVHDGEGVALRPPVLVHEARAFEVQLNQRVPIRRVQER